MSRKKRWVLGIAAIIVLDIVGVWLLVSSTSAAIVDSDYVITITVDNQSGSTLANIPVAFSSAQPANLIADSFIQADAEDVIFANVSDGELSMVAQGMSSDSVTWWLDVDSVGDGSSQAFNLYMGDPTATRDQAFRFDGTTDTVTAADHADLDITDDLTLEVTANIIDWEASPQPVVIKTSAYELDWDGNVTGGRFMGKVYGAAASETLRPDGDDTYVAWVPTGTCGASHYTCIDESVADGNTSYLDTNGVAGTEIYTLGATALPSAYIIGSVVVYFTALEITSEATLTPSFRLGGDTQAGAPQALTVSYAEYSQTITRPGGGSWTVADLNDLKVLIYLEPGGAASQSLTQVYVVVNYIPYVEVLTLTDDLGADIARDVEYTVTLTYDKDLGSNQVKLAINGVNKANGTLTGLLASTDNDVVIGSGINGYLSDVSIKGGATEYLRYDFEPDEITETQQGNSGNSWVWTGSVEDVSAGGSDHDGTYSLTRDMTDITVYAGAVRLTNPDTLYGVSTPADILGTIPLTPTVMPAGGDFPGRAGLNEAATAITDNNVMSSLAWWFILTSMVSITLGIGVWAWTTHEFWGALAWLSPYWIAYGAGGIFPLWLVMILTLVAVFFVLAVRKGREEL